MNPVFDNPVRCLICDDDLWEDLSEVNHPRVTFYLQMCNACGFVAQNPPLSEYYLQEYYKNNYVRNNYKNDLKTIHQIQVN